MDKIIKPVENLFVSASKDQTTMLIIQTITVLVIVGLYDDLPFSMKHLIKSPIFKMVVTYINVYFVTKNVKNSFMITLAIYLAYYLFMMVTENLEVITMSPVVHPGCKDIKAADLIKMLGGTEESAKKMLSDMNIPNGIPLNDLNAPRIANFLINNEKKKISDSCTL